MQSDESVSAKELAGIAAYYTERDQNGIATGKSIDYFSEEKMKAIDKQIEPNNELVRLVQIFTNSKKNVALFQLFIKDGAGLAVHFTPVNGIRVKEGYFPFDRKGFLFTFSIADHGYGVDLYCSKCKQYRYLIFQVDQSHPGILCNHDVFGIIRHCQHEGKRIFIEAQWHPVHGTASWSRKVLNRTWDEITGFQGDKHPFQINKQWMSDTTHGDLFYKLSHKLKIYHPVRPVEDKHVLDMEEDEVSMMSKLYLDNNNNNIQKPLAERSNFPPDLAKPAELEVEFNGHKMKAYVIELHHASFASRIITNGPIMNVFALDTERLSNLDNSVFSVQIFNGSEFFIYHCPGGTLHKDIPKLLSNLNNTVIGYDIMTDLLSLKCEIHCRPIDAGGYQYLITGKSGMMGASEWLGIKVLDHARQLGSMANSNEFVKSLATRSHNLQYVCQDVYIPYTLIVGSAMTFVQSRSTGK